MPKKTICFTLEDHEARALAQFFARMHWTVIRKYADGDKDADIMHLALVKAKVSLNNAGFSTRLATLPPDKT